jgi:segregation and condensation protein B
MELSKLGELEALLFAGGDPLTLDRLSAALSLSPSETNDLVARLQTCYQNEDRGLTLRRAAGGIQLVTKQEAAGAIRELYEKQEQKISNAAMETLAIVAYKQPVTKSEIEATRGVKVDGVVNTLTDMELIAEVGRKEVIGRPILYGTTEKFLVTFGLDSLAELPELPEELLDVPDGTEPDTDVPPEEKTPDEAAREEKTEVTENDD